MNREIKTISLNQAVWDCYYKRENILDLVSFQTKFLEEFLALPQDSLKENVEFHRSKLGKQDFCFNSFERNWVWSGEKWRVYVSQRGTNFEVLPNLTIEELKEVWNDYFGKMMFPLLPFA